MAAIPIPDRRMEAFVNGWTRVRLPGQEPDYWNPRGGAWEVYKRDTYTITTVPGSPLGLGGSTPPEAYQKVEQSWTSIRTQHPTAIFDPRTKGWCTASKASPAGDSDKEREQLARKELEAIDLQYRNRILNHDEWTRRRKEIRQKYGYE